MSDTRDAQIAELEAQILALRSKPAAPEPAPEPEAEPAQPEPAEAALAAPEAEPVTVPELPAFMRQYPEPPPGPVLLKSASNEAAILHP